MFIKNSSSNMNALCMISLSHCSLDKFTPTLNYSIVLHNPSVSIWVTVYWINLHLLLNSLLCYTAVPLLEKGSYTDAH